MAAKEMWDYLSATPVVADYTAANLTVKPQRVLVEDGQRNQIVHTGDDGSEEVIELDDTVVFFVTLEWTQKSAADAGTVFDFYWDSAKAKCMARSFYWESPDGHTYTVRFNSKLPRQRKVPSLHAIPPVVLKILGRAS